MASSPLALAQSALLIFLGVGLTAWGLATWLKSRSPGVEWERGTELLLSLPLLLFGLLFLAAGVLQALKLRRGSK